MYRDLIDWEGLFAWLLKWIRQVAKDICWEVFLIWIESCMSLGFDNGGVCVCGGHAMEVLTCHCLKFEVKSVLKSSSSDP